MRNTASEQSSCVTSNKRLEAAEEVKAYKKKNTLKEEEELWCMRNTIRRGRKKINNGPKEAVQKKKFRKEENEVWCLKKT